ncbi:hypothetical protein NDU88_003811 [Pleurodeles waltl]|uniref:Pol-like protein n=1 Tax=Pleurodeles waltl TaxID=8319 RepID=A0AAV7UDS3_PLEWA|nr:hypothetical protein NDU88_003811 [Pleurodeles waltl]
MLTPRRMQGQFLAAGYTTHSRGVLLWASRTSAIDFKSVDIDPGRQYVAEQCNGRALTFLLIGIYGPNYDDPQFYRDLAAQAERWGDLPQLWCGDFNCTLTPKVDRSGGRTRSPAAAARAILDIAANMGLVDVWRDRYLERLYTLFGSPRLVHTYRFMVGLPQPATQSDTRGPLA